ncbi:hypothetical protein QUF72_00640 [Desulfobacterales bacterium HSG2]|nr:hypothetical protein [Desulfobacterales bacterium HSG2]MDM8548543.1 hypothetical protein [Desulfobacterales bacterium HSG2]
MKFIQHIIEKIDDNLNPIVVKELRQAVQSRFVTGILMIFLITLLITMAAFITSGMIGTAQYKGMGREVFSFLFPVFMVPSMLFVPAYTGTRMFRERTKENMDLLFISTISPAAIIRGKLLAGIIITLLIFSACLPFMTLTYLLRGVDLPSVFVILAMAFIAITIAIQFALFIASVSFNRVFRSVLGIAGAGFIFGSCMSVIALGHEMLRSGVGSRLGSSDFWHPAAAVLILAGLFTGFVHLVSVAAISHSSCNRAKTLRSYTTFAWIVTGIMAFVSGHYFSVYESVEIWFTLSVLTMGVWLTGAVSERDGQSTRVALTIPKAGIRRFTAFFFFSGAANGIAWVTAMTVITFCATLFSDISESDFRTTAGIFLYHYCHTLFGLFIRRKFLQKWVRPKFTWVVVLMIHTLAFVVPLFVGIFTSGSKYLPRMGKKLESGDIFGFVGIYAAVVILLNLPWFVRQVRGFVPPAKNHTD